MPVNLNIELLNEIKAQAQEEIMEWAQAIVDASLGPDGMAFGDEPLNLGQRIARVQDLASRGVMDVLKVRSPHVYDMLVRQYLHDVQQSPLMQDTAPSAEQAA
jgi:hypothetical protein